MLYERDWERQRIVDLFALVDLMAAWEAKWHAEDFVQIEVSVGLD